MKTAQEYQKRLQRHLMSSNGCTANYIREERICLPSYVNRWKHGIRSARNQKRSWTGSENREPAWYSRQDMLGMMLYIDAFAGNLKGVKKKLPYLEACNVNYLHLMPFLDTPKGKSDGGYAVADYRKVQPALGTMEELASLCSACHEKKMSVCMDFVMNHTSEDHEWAKRALAGEKEYQDRYFFYDTPDIPQEFEKAVPQVFPTTASR